jgi:hypothetical protein
MEHFYANESKNFNSLEKLKNISIKLVLLINVL